MPAASAASASGREARNSPLYDLMCRVVNGELSDWEIGYEEPSHVWRMTGNNAPWESEE